MGHANPELICMEQKLSFSLTVDKTALAFQNWGRPESWTTPSTLVDPNLQTLPRHSGPACKRLDDALFKTKNCSKYAGQRYQQEDIAHGDSQKRPNQALKESQLVETDVGTNIVQFSRYLIKPLSPSPVVKEKEALRCWVAKL